MMHTPGPWTVRHDFRSGSGKLCIGVSAARIGPKSGAVAWPSGVDDAQELANARLIAAAPALLEALQAAIPALVRLGDFVGNVDEGGPSGQGHIDRCAIIMQAKRAIELATSGA